MAKTAAGSSTQGFVKSFKGVPAGIGKTSKLLQRIGTTGLAEFFQSNERRNQLSTLRRLSSGKDFGLSPEEAGRIQEEGRGAQEAAFSTNRDAILNARASGNITGGQLQNLLQGASFARSAGLADFQRQEFLRKLEEARQKPLFQLQSTEALANALTGIPNFNQINELLKTRIAARGPGGGAAFGAAGGGGAPGGPNAFGRAAGGALAGFAAGGPFGAGIGALGGAFG